MCWERPAILYQPVINVPVFVGPDDDIADEPAVFVKHVIGRLNQRFDVAIEGHPRCTRLEELEQLEGRPFAPVLADLGLLLIDAIMKFGSVNALEAYLQVRIRRLLTDNDVNWGSASVFVFSSGHPREVEGAGDISLEHKRCFRVDLDMNRVGIGKNVRRLPRRPKLFEVESSFNS